MVISDQLLGELIKSPLVLLPFAKNKEVMDRVNNLLPYSTGFEIECGIKNELLNDINQIKEVFSSVPFILDYDINGGYEQRFRIPNGYKGIVCLYLLAKQLVNYLGMNEYSGIHYHIDCRTDSTWNKLMDLYLHYKPEKVDKDWILDELDTWEYKGSYNTRRIGSGHNWIRFNGLGTMEFRIGEMTFDYDLLLKRIIHCNSIARGCKNTLKDIVRINIPEPTFEEVDANLIIQYQKLNPIAIGTAGQPERVMLSLLARKQAELDDEEIKKREEERLRQEDITPFVRKRSHKIGGNGDK